MDGQCPSEKHSFIISGMSMSLSLINLLIVLQMENACKKNYSFHSISNSFGTIQHITDRRKIYNYIDKITYHQQNTINNLIGELIVVVAFAAIFSQLLGIYKQT